VTAAPSTTRVAAVGAGRMGQGIALAFAYCGHSVSLVDLKPRSVEELSRLGQAAQSNLRRDLEFLASVDALAGGDVDVFLQRIRFVSEEHAAEAIAQADVLFESVPETMEAKRVGLGAISAFAQREALIASTTSTFDANVLAGLEVGVTRFDASVGGMGGCPFTKKAAGNVPIKLIWTREDDQLTNFAHLYQHFAYQIALDKNNKIYAWYEKEIKTYTWGQRYADPQLPVDGGKLFFHLVIDFLLDNEPAGSSATLTGRADGAEDGSRDGNIEIGIPGNDDRVVPAEFEE